MATGAGQPGPRDGLDPNTSSVHFPANYNSLHSKTLPVRNIRTTAVGVQGTDTFTREYFLGNTSDFSVFSIGGASIIQVSADPVSSTWVDMTSGTVSANTAIASASRYPWIRMKIAAGQNPDIWLFTKYPNN